MILYKQCFQMLLKLKFALVRGSIGVSVKQYYNFVIIITYELQLPLHFECHFEMENY